MAIVQKSTAIKRKSLLNLSKDAGASTNTLLEWVDKNAKNPLIICFGSVEPFQDKERLVVSVLNLDELGDLLSSLPEIVKTQKVDAIVVDSISFMRRLYNAHEAGSETLSIQDYGRLNNMLLQAWTTFRAMTPVWASTCAVVYDEMKKEWNLDFTSSMGASVYPLFGSIHYITKSARGDIAIQEDRDLALNMVQAMVAPVTKGKTASASASKGGVPQRTRNTPKTK